MSVGHACQSQERIRGWESDLDYFTSQVKQQHYVYKSRPLPETFVAKSEALRKNMAQLSDQQILVEFEGLAATLGDGHTYVLPWGADKVESKGLPFRFYLFSDGLFIIHAPESLKHLIGNRVVKFGDVAVEDAMKRIAPYISRDNEMGVDWIGPLFLSFQGALEAVGVKIKRDGIPITLADNRGEIFSMRLTATSIAPLKGVPKLIPSKISGNPVPLYLQNVKQTYWIKSLRHEGVNHLYVQFNQVIDDPAESLRDFSSRLSDSLKMIKPKKLIIDVRHNNGGNAELLPPLLNSLSAFQQENPKSTIVIMTGRNTFSAAQIFISKADNLLHPVFAGEPSSSKPNFVGEENGVMFPYSGAICSISNRYHESIPGDDRTWIEPTIKLELTSRDYFDNKDPLLEKILDY